VTAFERRRTILRILKEQTSIRVIDLAQMLGVSEGTIRNDLTALDEEHQLTRVHGGAVARSESALANPQRAPVVSGGSVAAAKARIARWAAELIEDGDSVLFDASLTVRSMVPFLKDRRNLTVVTNGVDVAREMAEIRSNTVILIGGIMSQDGLSVTGSLAEKYLKDLHIRRAFVTCSGFSLAAGLTEFDLYQVSVKAQMVRSAQETIALIDSSKVGKVGLTPFAAVSDIAHIFTDNGIDPEVAAEIQQRVPNLTICEENTVSSFSQQRQLDLRHYRIGFANLSESIPFAVDVRRGLERAAMENGNIDIIVGDNQLDAEAAVQVAEDLMARAIDLMIEYQIDEAIGGLLMNRFQRANIPVIAVDIPLVGATFFGVDNYLAGHMAGYKLGDWIVNHWSGVLETLLILGEKRAGSLPAARMKGQLDGLNEALGQYRPFATVALESGNTVETSEAAVRGAILELPVNYRVAAICFNDDAALGALAAARQLGREQNFVAVGQGADRRARAEIRTPGSHLIGSTAFMPELYGERLIEVALKLLRGEPVPPAIYNDCIFITAENIDVHYPE
jgi:ribose transport system substrate-binding protein